MDDITLKRATPEPGETAPIASIANGAVLYAIGDIHGRADLLKELHSAIESDAESRQSVRKIVVYLGDYTCRGPDSYGVVEMLCSDPLPGFERVFIRGNHEDIICRFLDGDLSWGAHWLKYGGIEALEAYGVFAKPCEENEVHRLAAMRDNLAAALPENHEQFLRDTVFSHREGDYIFVHAGIKPGIPFEQNDPNTFMWIRREFLGSDVNHGGVVVHGHTISDIPEVRHNRIGIDTGAYRSGTLTCLVLEGNQQWFLQTKQD